MYKRETGFCVCCESDTTFESEQSWLRDHYICTKCGSIPRERHLAHVLDKILPNWKELSIHESSPAERGGSLKLKNGCPNYIASHYFPDKNEVQVDSFKNIDLQQQTFENESFDLVVTQDVFEHLPYPDLAVKEIARTLKVGGYFISTIPLMNGFSETEKWADLINGEVCFIGEPDYHGNPIDPKGSPVFWHYGYDIADKLREWSGMQTIIIDCNNVHLGIEAELTEIVICKKVSPTPF